MKTKELKNLAKRIAEQEKILASTSDPVEQEKAQNAIERLINNTHFDSFAEMDMVWDMVANLLA
jgi:hypothetical protein